MVSLYITVIYLSGVGSWIASASKQSAEGAHAWYVVNLNFCSVRCGFVPMLADGAHCVCLCVRVSMLACLHECVLNMMGCQGIRIVCF